MIARITKYVRAARNNEFTSGVVTLFIGTAVSQVLPVAVLPILTKLLLPQELGLFATYFGILSIGAIFVVARYDMAVMQPGTDEDASQLFWGALLVNVVVTTVVSASFVCCINVVTDLLDNKALQPLLYVLPISLFLTGLNGVQSMWLNRAKMYVDMSRNRIIQGVVSAVLSVLAGIGGFGAFGLALANLAGYIVAQSVMLKAKLFKSVDRPDLHSIMVIMRRYRHYPLFDMPASGLNVLAQQSYVLMLPSLFGVAYAGYYFLVMRVFVAPITLLGASIGSVYRREATTEFQRCGCYRQTYVRTLRKLVFLGAPIFLVIGISSSTLFPMVFGEKWLVAGKIAEVLTPMFFFRFVASPLSFGFYISEKLHYDLAWQILNLFCVLVSLAIGYATSNFFFSIYVLSALGSIMYVIYLSVSYRLSTVGWRCI